MTVPPIVAVVGATAAGKTGLSLDLAERLDGEIVNTDSMQVYRGMDIGTAKLPLAERRGIPHHLMDLLDIDEIATVADFQALARAAIADIRGRGKVPVLVGGSALYVRAILDHYDFPGTDPEIRAELEAEAAERGTAVLHARLKELDPEAATKMEPSNGRRIVRALEAIAVSGKKFSSSEPRMEYADPRTVQIGVDIDRPTLDVRIAQRVDEMFETGFVAEVEHLMANGLEQARTAAMAIGYAQVRQHLAGEITEAEARERTVFATRRFSRRQDSWFRKDDRISWIRFDAEDRLERALDVIAALD
ncbi:tRNA (adenosine(37)-N6)-dimethylallyltransferase MiaA [Nocardioides yefusunii]|uniref:tRNA dimethylallyltransferase n=1 Tax=Nocardioides yefusunii TaxID=2500546 RepID=A0ABW1QZC9_9ACTN|nr:tRNA (adenosine(37)-N6)-dimethylallyltransferase MiaA [Nocardioides yefusunii]